MADLLIRDVPDDVVAAIDAQARRLGLSRTEYLRRRLTDELTQTNEALATNDLTWFAETFTDLADPDVMAKAWQ